MKMVRAVNVVHLKRCQKCHALRRDGRCIGGDWCSTQPKEETVAKLATWTWGLEPENIDVGPRTLRISRDHT